MWDLTHIVSVTLQLITRINLIIILSPTIRIIIRTTRSNWFPILDVRQANSTYMYPEILRILNCPMANGPHYVLENVKFCPKFFNLLFKKEKFFLAI